MKASVNRAGIQATIQDFGRYGHRDKGMPIVGALDKPSMMLANWLVGNQLQAPVLEIPMQGISLMFESACQLGIAGATANVELNEEMVNTAKTITVNSGDELVIGDFLSGFRLYMSITGGFKGQEFLGSFSTDLVAGVGGLGRPLKKDDKLESAQPKQQLILNREKPEHLIQKLDIDRPIRIIPGPEYDLLDHYSSRRLTNQEYSIGSASNRMGIRLVGEQSLNTEPHEELISSPVLPGIIQLPPSGQPVILLNDGQTIGGYARIAKVAEMDMPYLAQQAISKSINFVEIDITTAERGWLHQQKRLKWLFEKE